MKNAHRRRRGIEVALIGIDGTGKSSVARVLQSRMPAKVIHMGTKNFQTFPARLADRGLLFWPLSRFAVYYELVARRITGWLLARQGWIVIYDRHPLERYYPRPTRLAENVVNWLIALCRCEPRLTLWLTGDYEKIYQRKKEYSVLELEAMDHRLAQVLAALGIPFTKINVTEQDLNSVIGVVAQQIQAALPALPTMTRGPNPASACAPAELQPALEAGQAPLDKVVAEPRSGAAQLS